MREYAVGLRGAHRSLSRADRAGRDPTYPERGGEGLRHIGTFSALYRVAIKCRREHLAKFEASLERPFFAADVGRGPISLVWRQALDIL